MTANRCKEAKVVVSCTNESNNHANTWCFGPNFVMDHFTEQTCSVSGYDKKIQLDEVCIDTGLTLWTDPTTGQSQLLQVNQGLDMRYILDHTLANLINVNRLVYLGVMTLGTSINLLVLNVKIQICQFLPRRKDL